MTTPDRIGPDYGPKRTWGEKFRRFGKAFTTKYDSVSIATYKADADNIAERV